jgi:hypothetical protein
MMTESQDIICLFAIYAFYIRMEVIAEGELKSEETSVPYFPYIVSYIGRRGEASPLDPVAESSRRRRGMRSSQGHALVK